MDQTIGDPSQEVRKRRNFYLHSFQPKNINVAYARRFYFILFDDIVFGTTHELQGVC